jgi:rhodanese-related sulfurtransferase/ABC-type phosphate/phosphonate transport system substrate-binding protein
MINNDGYSYLLEKTMHLFSSWTKLTKHIHYSVALGLTASAYLLGAPVSAQTGASNQLKIMVALDPTASIGRSFQMQQTDQSLRTTLAQQIQLETSADFANVLRSTRTGEYGVYIAPPHVIASALNHGYQVISSNSDSESYVLVVKPNINSAADLKGKKIYLPHQDSLTSYMAKGLINEGGGSLSLASKVDYQRTSGAGLVAVQMGLFDATVVRKSEFLEWEKTAKGVAKILAESPVVPAGVSIAVKKDLPDTVRTKIAQWSTTKDGSVAGFGLMKTTLAASDTQGYKYLANLGHFTPNALPQVERIDAAKAVTLMKEGAVLVDVRTEKEYKAKRIPGAVLAPYIEKSLKETNYKPELDDFSAADKLAKDKPSIFACNGAECWKSYKASRAALSKGFTKVYWLRGGLPEWEAAGLPLAKD